MELPKIGDQLKSRYHLDEILGEGGFAVVFRGTDQDLGRDVAVKVLKPGRNGYDKNREERFLRELRAIASLKSQHTVTLFDYGRTAQGTLFMVCEFADGEDLEAYLVQRGVISEHETVVLLSQILESMEEAHSQGLLHRDIKPANIMVKVRRGRISAQLLDFGLAKSLVGDEVPLTAAGKVVGTPRYMAPEQLLGLELLPATDIYSLGLVAYECLVGPRTAPMFMPNKSLRLPRDAASPALCSIVNRMLARKVDARFSNTDEVLLELDQLNLIVVESPPQRVERAVDASSESPNASVSHEPKSPKPVRDEPALRPPHVDAAQAREEMPTLRAIPSGFAENAAPTETPAALGEEDVESTTEELGSMAETLEDFEPEPSGKPPSSREVRKARKKVYGPLPKELRRERRARERRVRKHRQVFLYVGLAMLSAVACVLALVAFDKLQSTEAPPRMPPNLRPLVSSAIDDDAPKLDAGCMVPWAGGVIALNSASRHDRSFTATIPMSAVEQRLPLVVFTTSLTIPSTVDTGFQELAAERGFALIEAPTDQGRAVVLDAVVTAQTSLCIDSSQIFLVAVGDDPVEVVADDLFNFAAVVTMTGRALPPPDGIPHLHIHNTGDRRTPRFRGSKSCAFRSLPSVDRFTGAWVSANGCASGLKSYKYPECRYTECVRPFVTCTFAGGTPWEQNDCSARPNAPVGYAELMWDFFQDSRSSDNDLRIR